MALSGVGVLAAAGVGALTTGPGSASAASPAGPCGRVRTAPRYKHVVWIVMENHSYSQVMSSPYLSSLAAQCGVATNYRAISHPSLPNYLAMTSGTTHGVRDDRGPRSHRIPGRSIFSQVGPRGWRALQEGMPSACHLTSAGRYEINHNPAAYYTGLRSACRERDVSLRTPANISARFTFVTPDMCHDTHNCTTATGDAWLRGFISRLVAAPQYRAGTTAIFITWDESGRRAGNRVASFVVAPSTPPGTRSATAFSHYSLLRTTETLLGVGTKLGGAARSTDMLAAFNL